MNLLFALVLLALTVAGPAQACTILPNFPAVQAELIRAINAQRRAHSLPTLSGSAALTKAAQSLACDNAAHRTVGHTGSTGSTLKSRLASQGYRFSIAAENAAGGYPDATTVTDGWMQSPGHRRNILTPSLREIGVGVATGSDGLLYWIIDLGAQR